MSASTSAVVLAGTVTLGPSGGVDSTTTIYPVKASAPFKKLTIIVHPIGSTSVQYSAEVLFDGESYSSHSFPDPAGRVIAFLHYDDVLFPPTIGGDTIPAFVQGKTSLRTMPIALALENLGSESTTFSIKVTFEEFDSCRMSPMTF
jgi:hypothetical protein